MGRRIVAQRLCRHLGRAAEDAITALLLRTREHMMHVRHDLNPPDFVIDPLMLTLVRPSRR